MARRLAGGTLNDKQDMGWSAERALQVAVAGYLQSIVDIPLGKNNYAEQSEHPLSGPDAWDLPISHC
jgi:hypothetical protein